MVNKDYNINGTIEGFETIPDKALCSRCKIGKPEMVLALDDNINGLPVQKMFYCCKKCAIETGVLKCR